MLEIAADDISALRDDQLRELVAMLSRRECFEAGLPTSAVTAGGHHLAPDGGIDVRVSLDADACILNFVPRPSTGFQAKHAKRFERSKILNEMAPKNTPRPAISELANAGGAYVLVNGRESLADELLQSRKDAMAEAVVGLPNAASLKLDYYDASRLADWSNRHPAVVLWVLDRLGRANFGYRPFGSWSAPQQSVDEPYLVDETARIIDACAGEPSTVSIVEGLNRVRHTLTQARGIVRLVGLSGTGKTRFAQALFDERVAESPLDPTAVVYTDIANKPNPPAREALARLACDRARVVLIVDNCGPELHRTLAEELMSSRCHLSLLTIEFDISDDDSEETSFFLLKNSSTDLIEDLIKHRAPHISALDRERIAAWADGNARLALSLTQTMQKGGSISKFSDLALFKRLFYQRKSESADLLRTAAVAALVYSFDVETTEGADQERSLLAELVQQSSSTFYGNVAELLRRGLVQKRGRWRAVLPQALAHHLAREALRKLPPEDLEKFIGDAPARLLRSFARQLGHLHDSERAREMVGSWLAENGRLGDFGRLSEMGLTLFHNVAPVNPEAALQAIQRFVANMPRDVGAPGRRTAKEAASTLRSIAYDGENFRRVILALTQLRSVSAGGQNEDDIAENFQELFWVTSLSGTRAHTNERIAVIDELLKNSSSTDQDYGLEALKAMLKCQLFSSSHQFGFGAHQRDFGWTPSTVDERRNWFAQALKRIEQNAISNSPLVARARVILAEAFPALWAKGLATDALDKAMRAVAEHGFWAEGYIATFKAHKRSARNEEPGRSTRLSELRAFLEPRNLADRVKVYVLPRQWGFFDLATANEGSGKDTEARLAVHDAEISKLGSALASDENVLCSLLPELVAGTPGRAKPLGRGLASESADLQYHWRLLRAALAAAADSDRNPDLMLGFLSVVRERDRDLAAHLLDQALEDAILAPFVVSLQIAAGLDLGGLHRLREALRLGATPIGGYSFLSAGRATDVVDPEELATLLLEIAATPGGHAVAVQILRMRLFSDCSREAIGPHKALLRCGIALLKSLKLEDYMQAEGYNLSELGRICLDGAAQSEVSDICHVIVGTIEPSTIVPQDIEQLILILFNLQTEVALDIFLLLAQSDHSRLMALSDLVPNAIRTADLSRVLGWANRDPYVRFAVLAEAVGIFEHNDDGAVPVISRIAWALLENSPDRAAVLSHLERCCYTWSFSGSVSANLEAKREAIKAFLELGDPVVIDWVHKKGTDWAEEAQLWRARERDRDESFE